MKLDKYCGCFKTFDIYIAFCGISIQICCEITILIIAPTKKTHNVCQKYDKKTSITVTNLNCLVHHQQNKTVSAPNVCIVSRLVRWFAMRLVEILPIIFWLLLKIFVYLEDIRIDIIRTDHR